MLVWLVCLGVVVFGVVTLRQTLQAQTVARVTCSFQENLAQLGQRIRAYSRYRPEILCFTKAELVASGVIAEGEWDFQEPALFTKVQRQWQNVPDLGVVKEDLWIAIVLECYEGEIDGCNVLYANGKVLYFQNSKTDVIAEANLHRKELGLPQFPSP
ncbi:MAG: hypothetical protein HOP29_03505 [Phycisphaerales bacterium]|nr:hypothetical protein [Phycisphaerales bacterium]